jgi:transcriptional regulator with XRE-family HTH domain
MTTVSKKESVIDVGRRLKSMRAQSGLTLRQLAEKSGVAFTTIQKIESGSISPTVGILLKIAGGLQVKMTALLQEDSGEEQEPCDVRFIKKKSRTRVAGKGQDIEVEYVAQNLADPEMFGFHIAVGPGEGSGPEPLTHGGEEIVIGIHGVITFTVGEDEFIVGPGDCLHFKSDISHRWMNFGAKSAKFYLVCTESGLMPAPPDAI